MLLLWVKVLFLLKMLFFKKNADTSKIKGVIIVTIFMEGKGVGGGGNFTPNTAKQTPKKPNQIRV